jgi:hypothetical protein
MNAMEIFSTTTNMLKDNHETLLLIVILLHIVEIFNYVKFR